jgi:hypothetical protein
MQTLNRLVLLCAALAFAGCSKEEPAASAPPPAAAVSKPAPASGDGYLGTLARSQQKAVKTIDTTSLNQEVQLFNAQKGRNPKDLNELVTKGYLGKLPDAPAGMKLNYDAAAGKVSVVPQ